MITKMAFPGDDRIETGPIQFGADWPGVFIRGDDCVNFLSSLRTFMSGDDTYIDRTNMEMLIRLLEEAIQK